VTENGHDSKKNRRKTVTQKQWLFSYYDLGDIANALGREASRMEDPALAHLVSHKRRINELLEKLTAIMVSAERDYGESTDENDGVISEQVLVTLIPQDVNERWDEPYTVVPIGEKWAAVHKETVERPVGEKLYTQYTHAHRAKRRLNTAYWKNKARAEAEAKRAVVSQTALASADGSIDRP
jgi:hypothetical protein